MYFTKFAETLAQVYRAHQHFSVLCQNTRIESLSLCVLYDMSVQNTMKNQTNKATQNRKLNSPQSNTKQKTKFKSVEASASQKEKETPCKMLFH